MAALTRYEVYALLALCLLGVVFMAAHREVGYYGAETDVYAYYAPTAQALHHGELKLDLFHPPVYGWVLGLLTFIPLFPGEFEAGIFLSMLGYLAVVAFTFLLARECCRHAAVGAVAAILVASNPFLLDMACRSAVHLPYLALTMASIYLAMRQKPLLTGAMTGLAMGLRTTWYLSIIPLLFLRGKKTWQGWAVTVAAWAALSVITYSYFGTLTRPGDRLNMAAGLYNQEIPTNAGLWEQQHEAIFSKLNTLQIALYDPAAALETVGDHAWLYTLRLLARVMIPPLGLLALFGLRRRFWVSLNTPLIYWTVASYLVLLISFWGPQYVIGLVPLLTIAAAVQLVDLARFRWLKQAPRVLLYGLTLFGLYVLLEQFPEGPAHVKVAAQSLRGSAVKRVVAMDPRVAYYSGKLPGDLRVLPGDTVQLTGESILGNPYELGMNDTLQWVLDDPNFRAQFDVERYGLSFVMRLKHPSPTGVNLIPLAK